MILNIDGIDYEPVNRDGEQLEIVVLDRGWVFIGLVRFDGEQIIIRDALNIRRWGTDKGLGQLAQDGPQEETQLDPSGTVNTHRNALVCRFSRFSCLKEKWDAFNNSK